ncbi:MAG: hypothetical protein GF349_02245 [Candidatus Magasanikbacteria bacterium]|nr:hypothetical protein [Candidatus Magasanikbacteria bacterium]
MPPRKKTSKNNSNKKRLKKTQPKLKSVKRTTRKRKTKNSKKNKPKKKVSKKSGKKTKKTTTKQKKRNTKKTKSRFKKSRKIKTKMVVVSMLVRLIIVVCILLILNALNFFSKPENKLPLIKILQTKKVIATAYSSTIGQTDSTPCITANGYDLCENMEENVIAANFLPFGTKIRIPEIYGEKILTVQDRMNSRYGNNRIDVWQISREKAKNFGVKVIEIEIVEVE